MANSEPALALHLAAPDNVAVALADLAAGTLVSVAGRSVRLCKPVGMGHKFAVRDIAAGERIVKYNCPIGSATRRIEAGEHVHTLNVRSDYLANTVAVSGEAP